MLSIKHLTSEFLGPVDLEIAAGTCVAISGASGAGKTLLLRAIADLDPNDGQVSWQGRAREAMPAPEWRRLVALVPAESGWWEDRVGANFPTPPESGLLADVGLPDDVMDWDVARLSSGERQRLATVRALARRPHVLLLDEPTAALDVEAAAKVEAVIQRQLAGGAAIVLVTHDPAQAARLAQQTVVMDGGRLAQTAATAR